MKRFSSVFYVSGIILPALLLAGAIEVSLAELNSGLFEPYEVYPTGSRPEAVAVGDVNGDGRNDAVMTTSFNFDDVNDYKLFVLLQGESGQLSPPIKYPTQGSYTNRPLSVDVGDVNNDGLVDVVVGNSKASLEVFIQTSTGELEASALYPTAFSTVIKIADLNNDGLLDVAGIGWGGSDVAVFLQNTNGTLDAGLTYYAPHGGYDDLDIGDINSDGLTDIVVMSGQGYAHDNLAVLTQNTGGSFEPAVFYDLGGNELTKGVAVGDVNADGANDIAVTYGGNSPNSKLGVFYQNGAGGLAPPVSHDSFDVPDAVEIADVDQDGRQDIVLLHEGWEVLGVYLQQGEGALQQEELYPVPLVSQYNPQGLDLGDINGDDRPDVVIADQNNGLVVLRHTSSRYLFRDDMESGAVNWTVTGSDGGGGPALWNLSNHRFRSAGTSFYYGRGDTLTYNSGARNYGSITSIPIDLTGVVGAQLQFFHLLRTENLSPYDTARVQISADDGASWNDVFLSAVSTPSDVLEGVDIDIGAYAGQLIRLRFSFDTIDSLYNNFEGWVIDDISIATQ